MNNKNPQPVKKTRREKIREQEAARKNAIKPDATLMGKQTYIDNYNLSGSSTPKETRIAQRDSGKKVVPVKTNAEKEKQKALAENIKQKQYKTLGKLYIPKDKVNYNVNPQLSSSVSMPKLQETFQPRQILSVSYTDKKPVKTKLHETIKKQKRQGILNLRKTRRAATIASGSKLNNIPYSAAFTPPSIQKELDLKKAQQAQKELDQHLANRDKSRQISQATAKQTTVDNQDKSNDDIKNAIKKSQEAGTAKKVNEITKNEAAAENEQKVLNAQKEQQAKKVAIEAEKREELKRQSQVNADARQAEAFNKSPEGIEKGKQEALALKQALTKREQAKLEERNAQLRKVQKEKEAKAQAVRDAKQAKANAPKSPGIIDRLKNFSISESIKSHLNVNSIPKLNATVPSAFNVNSPEKPLPHGTINIQDLERPAPPRSIKDVIAESRQRTQERTVTKVPLPKELEGFSNLDKSDAKAYTKAYTQSLVNNRIGKKAGFENSEIRRISGIDSATNQISYGKVAANHTVGSVLGGRMSLTTGYGMGWGNAWRASRKEHAIRAISTINPLSFGNMSIAGEALGLTNKLDRLRFNANPSAINRFTAAASPLFAGGTIAYGMFDNQDMGEIATNLLVPVAALPAARAGISIGAMVTPAKTAKNLGVVRGIGLAGGAVGGFIAGAGIVMAASGALRDVNSNTSTMRSLSKKLATSEVYVPEMNSRQSLTARQMSLNKLARSGLNDRALLLANEAASLKGIL